MHNNYFEIFKSKLTINANELAKDHYNLKPNKTFLTLFGRDKKLLRIKEQICAISLLYKNKKRVLRLRNV
jgi:hypothetical protein